MLFLVFASYAKADWVNLTGAQSAPNIVEIYIEDDHVRLVLEIYVSHLDKFIDLLPETFFKQAGVKQPPLKERLKRFSEETVHFVTGDKKKPRAEPEAEKYGAREPCFRSMWECGGSRGFPLRHAAELREPQIGSSMNRTNAEIAFLLSGREPCPGE